MFITSNNEKELPDAFLRRCFFHYIRFPDREHADIVDVHFPGLKPRLLREALNIFYDIRDVPGMKKKPSTSELLDWIKLLVSEDIDRAAERSATRASSSRRCRRAYQERAGCAVVRAARVHAPAEGKGVRGAAAGFV